MSENVHVVLQSRPGVSNPPREENFSCNEYPYPSRDLNPGEVLLKTCYLSVDAALRCCMNEDPGVDYVESWQIGSTIQGLGGTGVVIQSRHPQYQPGDLVMGQMEWPWVLYFVVRINSKSGTYHKLDKKMIGDRISLPTSLTTVGLTALLGIQEKGHVDPSASQTLVVSGAAGATGSLAGQIGKLKGCANVVGICGTQEKCNWLVDELGFDHAINYKTEDVATRLAHTCPHGVDIYFDNVGGDLSNHVIQQMNCNSHVILCGQISQYNKDLPYPPPIPDNIEKLLNDRNITRGRFLVLNYPEKFEKSMKQLYVWIQTGQLTLRETVVEGLENAGHAFCSLMRGGNIGKQIIHVADP